MNASAAAIVFAGLSAVVAVFQLALAAGAPWGALAMGGRYPGVFPPKLRLAAIFQALIVAGLAVIVLVRAGWFFPGWQAFSRSAVWGVFAFSALSAVLNLVTPSKWERAIWGPVALAMLLSSFLVARS